MRSKSRYTPSAAGSRSVDWARRFRNADPEAVYEVQRRVEHVIVNKCGGISREDREDLRQEIMSELWRAVHKDGFDVLAGFWGFVALVASRRSIDWRRARRTSEPIEHDLRSRAPSALDHVVEIERLGIVFHVLQQLPSRCRELLLLRLVEEKTYREIGEILNADEGSLRVMMYRCLKHARNLQMKMAGNQAATDLSNRRHR